MHHQVMLEKILNEEKPAIELNREVPAEFYIVDVLNDKTIIDILYLDTEVEDKVSKTIVTSNETKLDAQHQHLFIDNITHDALIIPSILPPSPEASILLHEDTRIEDEITENTNSKVSSTLLFECGTCYRSIALSICADNKKRILFQCKLCTLLLCSQVLVQDHENEMHSVKSDVCSQCISEFCKQTQPKVDHDRHTAALAQCVLCDKGFTRLYDLKIHMHIHLGIKAHACNVCGKCFSHSSNLVCHKRIHSGEKPYVCNLCNKGFRQVTALIGHELSHSQGLSCPLCSSKFKNIIGLIRHSNTAHGFHMTSKAAYKMAQELLQKRPHCFYCSTCGERFRTKNALTNHVSCAHTKGSNSPDEVSAPPSIVNVPIALEADAADSQVLHLFDVMPETAESAFRHDSELATCNATRDDFPIGEFPLYKESLLGDCSIRENTKNVDLPEDLGYDNCYKLREFLSDFSVTSQIETQPIAAVATKSSSKSTTTSPAKKLVCGECGKRFSRQWQFKLHLSIHDPSLRRYSCTQCDETFVYNSSLERHSKKHSDILANYNCLICSKSYKSGDALRQHTNRVHKGKVKHSCPFCSKCFFAATEYKYHLRLHRKESPFMCSSCGKTFAHVSHLHRHEKIHSGIRPHACPVCPNAFIQAGELRRHMKRHTKKTTIAQTLHLRNASLAREDAESINFLYVTQAEQNTCDQVSGPFMHADTQSQWTADIT